MRKTKLDKDEKQLLEAFEAGEFESVLTPAQKKQIQDVASQTSKKDKRISIQVSSIVSQYENKYK